MRLAMIAFMQSFSESNTRAGPVIECFFSPVTLATQPSVARLPLRIARCPSLYIGSDQGRITCWPARGSSGTSFSISAMVLPWMVMQSPCSTPFLSRIFSTCGTPPARWKSTATKRPEGFRSHSTGTLRRTRSKSSMLHFTPAALAIAR